MGIADRVISHALGDRLGWKVTPMKFLAAVERDEACQAELRDTPHLHGGEADHLFGDIEEFWAAQVTNVINKWKQKGVSIDLRTYVQVAKARNGIVPAAYCKVHDKFCLFPRAMFHQGSPPCTAFANFGKNDPTNVAK